MTGQLKRKTIEVDESKSSTSILNRLILEPFYNFLAFKKYPLAPELTQSFTFKIAQTENETSEALALLGSTHDLLNQLPRERQSVSFSKGLALPGTRLFIVKSYDVVIATAALIPDSAFGLPSDTIIPLKERRRNGRLIAEITNPIVRESHLKVSHHLLFPLFKLVLHTALHREKIDELLIVPSPATEDFFQRILQFERVTFNPSNPLEMPPPSKNKATHLHSYFISLSEQSLAQVATLWHSNKKRAPLYEYFFKTTSPNIEQLPPRKTLEVQSDSPSLSKMELMKRFPQLMQDWGPKDFQIIANLDIHKLFLPKTPSPNQSHQLGHHLENGTLSEYQSASGSEKERPPITFGGIRDRKSPRAEVRLKAWSFFPGENKLRESLLIDLSEEGFQLKANEGERPLKIGESFVLVFEVNDSLIHLESKIQWIRNDTRIGCALKEPNANWKKLVQEIYEELIGKARDLNRKNA